MKTIAKYLGLSVTLLTVAAFFVGCGSKNNDNANANKGEERMSTACYYIQATSNHQSAGCSFDYAAASGGTFTNYSRTGTSQYYSGGTPTISCGYGYQVPVYSQSRGLGCVDSARLNQNGTPARYSLDQASNTFVLQGAYTQIGNGSAYGANTLGNGYTVLRSCVPGGADDCPSGLSCRSAAGPIPSPVGLCYY